MTTMSMVFSAPIHALLRRPASCAGFVKVAAEQGASLVPIAALGEVTGLRNAIDIPWMQAWSYKRLGFPVPYLVVGR